jgi:hypothetical protein
MGGYVDSDCRRLFLDEIMDGVTRETDCGEEEEWCDACVKRRGRPRRGVAHGEGRGTREPSVEEVMAIQRLERRGQATRQRMEEQGGELDGREVRHLLERWKRECVVCWINQTGAPQHSLRVCQEEDAADAREALEGLKRERVIEYARYSCCFRCGCPPEFCEGWEEGGNGWGQTGQPCSYEDVMLGFFQGVGWTGAEVYDEWLRRMQGKGAMVEVEREDGEADEWEKGGSLVEFLGRKRGKLDRNELIYEFVWLGRRVEGLGGC